MPEAVERPLLQDSAAVKRSKVLFGEALTPAGKARKAIARAFRPLDFTVTEAVLDAAEPSFRGSDGQNRAQLIETILTAEDSKDYKHGLSDHNIMREDVPELLRDEGLHPLTTVLLRDRLRQAMPLGVIFSETRMSDYPAHVIGDFKPATLRSQVELEPYHTFWYLCEAMEGIMSRSRQRDVMSVVAEGEIPVFLMNYRTKMTGVALGDFEHDGKVIFAGNLYRPVNDDWRDTLYYACDADKGRLSLEKSTWAFMRPLVPVPTRLREYQHYAATLPDVHENHTFDYYGTPKTRKKYRLENKED